MLVKICGLTTPETVEAAADAGARYLGFVFFPKSPRNLTPGEARPLAAMAPPGVMKVALTVNPDDALIETVAALPIDMIQLHGAETPERVAEVKRLSGLPVMKAIKVREAEDLTVAKSFVSAADRLLFDAKPPTDLKNALPGGNALAFDWRLLAGTDWPLPWMLAGGLHTGNLAEAVATEGVSLLHHYRDLQDRLASAMSDATRVAGEFEGWEPVEEKTRVIAAEDTVIRLRRELAEAASAVASPRATTGTPSGRSAWLRRPTAAGGEATNTASRARSARRSRGRRSRAGRLR